MHIRAKQKQLCQTMAWSRENSFWSCVIWIVTKEQYNYSNWACRKYSPDKTASAFDGPLYGEKYLQKVPNLHSMALFPPIILVVDDTVTQTTLEPKHVISDSFFAVMEFYIRG